MKTTLYWFSGTGNTLKAARMLAERLGDCELKPIMGELAGDRIELTGDRAGILFPLYFLAYPKPVVDFLARMENPSAIPLFAVVTRGFPPMGGVLWPLKKACRRKRTNVTGLFYLDMRIMTSPFSTSIPKPSWPPGWASSLRKSGEWRPLSIPAAKSSISSPSDGFVRSGTSLRTSIVSRVTGRNSRLAIPAQDAASARRYAPSGISGSRAESLSGVTGAYSARHA